MKTLILKHDGHEAHVPYELPSEVAVDCFVPEYGTFPAHVDLRGDEVVVTEVTGLPEWFCSHDAVLEQAGDVCAVFERALGALARMGESGPSKALDSALAKMSPQTQEDAKALSTIAEMALLESDLHTAWCRLPFAIADIKLAPTQVPTEWAAAKCLTRFITEVLVPRAQDMATKAAKRREAEWREELAEDLDDRDDGRRFSSWVDREIKATKEGA